MKPSDNIIVDADTPLGQLIVHKRNEEVYDVEMNGVIRHPKCTSEDVMRALGHYIQGISYQLEKQKKPKI